MRAVWALLAVSTVLLASMVVDGSRSRRQNSGTTNSPGSGELETETVHFCNITPFGCVNGGSCMEDADGDYYCECALGWTGENCTQPVVAELCDGFCENGGLCYIEDHYVPACDCQPGWQGEQCSEPDSFKPSTTSQGAGSSTSAPTNNSISSGVQVGAIVGLVVGIIVLIMVIFGIACIVAKVSKLRHEPHEHDSAIPPTSPSVIYDPNVHDHFDGSVYAREPPDPNHGKNLHLNSVYPNDIPRRYTSPPIHQQSRGFTEPSTGAYDYTYRSGPTRTPPRKISTAESDHEYTYIDPTSSDVSPRLPPALPVNRPPPPYTRAPPLASAYSMDPSRAPSRVSEHTYQSQAEYLQPRRPTQTSYAYEGRRPPAGNSRASNYSSRK